MARPSGVGEPDRPVGDERSRRLTPAGQRGRRRWPRLRRSRVARPRPGASAEQRERSAAIVRAMSAAGASQALGAASRASARATATNASAPTTAATVRPTSSGPAACSNVPHRVATGNSDARGDEGDRARQQQRAERLRAGGPQRTARRQRGDGDGDQADNGDRPPPARAARRRCRARTRRPMLAEHRRQPLGQEAVERRPVDVAKICSLRVRKTLSATWPGSGVPNTEMLRSHHGSATRRRDSRQPPRPGERRAPGRPARQAPAPRTPGPARRLPCASGRPGRAARRGRSARGARRRRRAGISRHAATPRTVNGSVESGTAEEAGADRSTATSSAGADGHEPCARVGTTDARRAVSRATSQASGASSAPSSAKPSCAASNGWPEERHRHGGDRSWPAAATARTPAAAASSGGVA